jgi:Zn-finger nucleic acid-binding protein
MLLATGCASDGKTAKADIETHPPSSGMMCPTCETVWVTERQTHGPRHINRLHSKREMTCPTCEATAQRVLLADGDVQLHECPECKVTPKEIKLDPRPSSSFHGPRHR